MVEEALIAFERRLQIADFIQNNGAQENVARLFGVQRGDAIERGERGRIILRHHQHAGQFAPGLRTSGFSLVARSNSAAASGNLR